MSHFYGRMQGQSQQVTRTGSKKSGMSSSLESWDYAIRSHVWRTSDEIDMAEVRLETKSGIFVAMLYKGELSAEGVENWRDAMQRFGTENVMASASLEFADFLAKVRQGNEYLYDASDVSELEPYRDDVKVYPCVDGSK